MDCQYRKNRRTYLSATLTCPLDYLHPLPHIDTYYFRIHLNTILPSTMSPIFSHTVSTVTWHCCLLLGILTKLCRLCNLEVQPMFPFIKTLFFLFLLHSNIALQGANVDIMNWMRLTQDRNPWRFLVNVALNLQVT